MLRIKWELGKEQVSDGGRGAVSGEQVTFDQEFSIGSVQFEMTIKHPSRDLELQLYICFEVQRKGPGKILYSKLHQCRHGS